MIIYQYVIKFWMTKFLTENILELPKREQYCLSMGISGLSASPLQQSDEMALSHSRWPQSPQEAKESTSHAYVILPLQLHVIWLYVYPTEFLAFPAVNYKTWVFSRTHVTKLDHQKFAAAEIIQTTNRIKKSEQPRFLTDFLSTKYFTCETKKQAYKSFCADADNSRGLLTTEHV